MKLESGLAAAAGQQPEVPEALESALAEVRDLREQVAGLELQRQTEG